MTCVFFYTLVVTDIPETATVEVRDGRCQARGCGLFQGKIRKHSVGEISQISMRSRCVAAWMAAQKLTQAMSWK